MHRSSIVASHYATYFAALEGKDKPAMRQAESIMVQFRNLLKNVTLSPRENTRLLANLDAGLVRAVIGKSSTPLEETARVSFEELKKLAQQKDQQLGDNPWGVGDPIGDENVGDELPAADNDSELPAFDEVD